MHLALSISEDTVSRPPTPGEKLTTIRQMLATLDTLTIAGRRHLMSKVVTFLGDQVELAIRHPGLGNRCVLPDQLALLKGESVRQLPSVPVFVERAEPLIALLALAA